MTDRRHTQRLPVQEAAIGSLRVVRDVEIHRLGRTEVTILTDGRVPPGERLLLQVEEAGGAPVNALVGALIRYVPLRLLDVGPGGCLFASPASIDVGTVGRLDVTLRDGHRVHAVRVCRSVRRKGRAWPYRVAAQLLILGAPAPASGRPVAIQPSPGIETIRRCSKDGLHG